MTDDNFLTVSCFFWHDDKRVRDYKFTPQHVVILRNMVQRHLTLPHQFVCVTDRSDVADELFKNHIRSVPLDWSKHVPGSCFVRLMLRHPRIGGILGRRILNLDLDCVIVDNIDSIASRKEDSVWWHNPNFPAPRRAFYQTSIQLFTAGTHTELWKDFDPNVTPGWVNRRFGGAEQAWVSERLPWDLPYWDEQDGIYGAGRLGDMSPGVTTTLPDNAKIVQTPGNRMPDQDIMKKLHPWIQAHYQ